MNNLYMICAAETFIDLTTSWTSPSTTWFNTALLLPWNCHQIKPYYLVISICDWCCCGVFYILWCFSGYHFRHFVCFICLCLMFYFSQNYYIFYGTGQEPIVNLGFLAMLSCMVAIGLAIGVTIAVGGLLFIQVVFVCCSHTHTTAAWVSH